MQKPIWADFEEKLKYLLKNWILTSETIRMMKKFFGAQFLLIYTNMLKQKLDFL